MASRQFPLPELEALDHPQSVIRIPDQVDVPLTRRVERLIDTAEFRRLASVRQLGFVSFVYPGAVHHRMEHSLGVYRAALLFLKHLHGASGFEGMLEERVLGATVVAALLHDIGHYPFCHPIEDIGLPGIPTHEQLAERILQRDPIAGLLRRDWELEPDNVLRLLLKKPASKSESIASSILSGPIDVDKLDYLMRDSLHAGVPYGRNFDAPRLIGSLCLNQERDGIAITAKGRTAAELMVVARYVMFSEVYWHHAVRSATAMFQRLIFEIHGDLRIERLFESNDATCPLELQRAAANEPTSLELFVNLFGPERVLYKRWGQFRAMDHPELFALIARRPFEWLVQCAESLCGRLTGLLHMQVPATWLLIDAPPAGLEVQFDIDVYDAGSHERHSLGSLSPIVRALAEQQFDDLVKQIRVFVHPVIREKIDQRNLNLVALLLETIAEMDSGTEA